MCQGRTHHNVVYGAPLGWDPKDGGQLWRGPGPPEVATLGRGAVWRDSLLEACTGELNVPDGARCCTVAVARIPLPYRWALVHLFVLGDAGAKKGA